MGELHTFSNKIRNGTFILRVPRSASAARMSLRTCCAHPGHDLLQTQARCPSSNRSFPALLQESGQSHEICEQWLHFKALHCAAASQVPANPHLSFLGGGVLYSLVELARSAGGNWTFAFTSTWGSPSKEESSPTFPAWESLRRRPGGGASRPPRVSASPNRVPAPTCPVGPWETSRW